MVLDFDGVILESTCVKAEAYRNMFEQFRDHRTAIDEYQSVNGGLPRRQQFKDVYEKILGQRLSESRLAELERQYSGLVVEKVLRAPFVTGALEFLRGYHAVLPLYLASATPEAELVHILHARSLRDYFRKIYGAPAKKEDVLREIMASHKGSRVVFVGDSPSDRGAAQASGATFIARTGSDSRLAGSPYAIRHLGELPEMLRRIG